MLMLSIKGPLYLGEINWPFPSARKWKEVTLSVLTLNLHVALYYYLCGYHLDSAWLWSAIGPSWICLFLYVPWFLFIVCSSFSLLDIVRFLVQYFVSCIRGLLFALPPDCILHPWHWYCCAPASVLLWCLMCWDVYLRSLLGISLGQHHSSL